MCGLPESLETFAHIRQMVIFSLVPVSLSACEQIRVEQNDGCILISLQLGEKDGEGKKEKEKKTDTQQTANRQTGQKMDLSLTARRRTLPPSSIWSVLSGGSHEQAAGAQAHRIQSLPTHTRKRESKTGEAFTMSDSP